MNTVNSTIRPSPAARRSSDRVEQLTPHDRNPHRRGAHPEALHRGPGARHDPSVRAARRRSPSASPASTDVDDIVTCTYRGHGHALALGVTPLQVIGEICGRTIGCAGGLGGSMHLVEPSVGLLPTFAIVGAGLPIACGAAMAARARGTDRVAVAIFGDGSANIGAFHESLNFAAIRKLPVVFVCENNLYGEYSRISLTTPVEDIADARRQLRHAGRHRRRPGRRRGRRGDGDAVARARRGDGPTLLEMKTYRYSGHSRSDPATYRPAGELDAWLKRDPINLFADQLVKEGAIEAGSVDGLRADIKEAVERATAEALAAPTPAISEIFNHITGDGDDEVRWTFWADAGPSRSSHAASGLAQWPSPTRTSRGRARQRRRSRPGNAAATASRRCAASPARVLPRPVFDFADGAAEDEHSLRRNESAFSSIELLPRPLNGAATRDLSITLLGKRLSMPVMIGPTGLSGLFWPDGERCAARAAAAAGTAFCLSHGSVCTLEQLAETGAAPRWMQVFVYRDRSFTHELTERAERAGYDALVLTIDNQLLGNRERDIRNGFTIPPRFSPATLAGMATRTGWLWRMRRRTAEDHLRQLRARRQERRPGDDRRPDGLAARPVHVVGRRRRPPPPLEAAAGSEGHHASRRGEAGRRSRRRCRDRLESRRAPARRNRGDARRAARHRRGGRRPHSGPPRRRHPARRRRGQGASPLAPPPA